MGKLFRHELSTIDMKEALKLLLIRYAHWIFILRGSMVNVRNHIKRG